MNSSVSQSLEFKSWCSFECKIFVGKTLKRAHLLNTYAKIINFLAIKHIFMILPTIQKNIYIHI